MATYSFYPEYGKSLTAIHDAKEGDIVTLSIGSNAYTLPQSRFGWQGSQSTSYRLPKPIGVNQFGATLFDLEGLGQCPLDGSFQNEETRRAAERRWLDEVLKR